MDAKPRMDETVKVEAVLKRARKRSSDHSTQEQDEKQKERVEALLDAMLEMRTPGEVSLTPDGKYVAFVAWEVAPGEQKPRGRIWVADTTTAKATPATSGKRSDHCPRWSPDGEQLAFITRPDGEKEKPQLHLIAAHDLLAGDASKARVACKMPNGVGHLAWSPDGRAIAFLSKEGEEPKRDPKVLTPARHRRLWLVRPGQSIPEPITPAGVNVWEYSWSQDSRQIALYYSQGAENNDWYHSEIGVVSSDGGTVRQLTHLKTPARALAWSQDATQIAYLAGNWSDPNRGCSDIFVLSLASGETRNLTPGIASSPSWCRWLPDGRRLLYCAVKGVTNQIGTVDSRTGEIEVLEEDFVMQRDQPYLVTTPDFRYCATIHSSSHQPADVWFGTLKATGIAWKRLSHLNPLMEEQASSMPHMERISYHSADGWRMEGLYMEPPIRSDIIPPPLYVHVHGGPSGTSCDGWSTVAPLFVAAGFAVFMPNMRGSWGQGMAFADAVLGDMGGKDFQDILNGIDHLVQEGRVDSHRICIGGWSNGGFLTAWAISQSRRFRAAMVGAGITEWLNMHAQSDIPDADILLLGADPLEKPEVYSQRSPMTHARNITTPTLILHGEDDPAVPVAQAYALHRALLTRHIPVECVIYPREGHGLGERDHLRDSLLRQIRWFERYSR